jgi:hypothetical protein
MCLPVPSILSLETTVILCDGRPWRQPLIDRRNS